jgi:hypothetical protein
VLEDPALELEQVWSERAGAGAGCDALPPPARRVRAPGAHDAAAPPPGPAVGVLAQAVALHRDTLGVLAGARARYADVVTLRLATVRPTVVVVAADAVGPLLHADLTAARAGEGRRRVLPPASSRSVLGGDGDQHAAARGRVAAFTHEAVARLHPGIVRRAPRGRLAARARSGLLRARARCSTSCSSGLCSGWTRSAAPAPWWRRSAGCRGRRAIRP